MIEFVHRIAELKAELDELRPLSADDQGRIEQKLRLEWNYHSNHLEGNQLTYGETRALILFGLTASGKPLRDHFEITGHDEAIKWIREVVREERPLTERFIRELHQLILKEDYKRPAQTPDGQPITKTIRVGAYKTKPNHVLTPTGEMLYFASPEETPAKMTELLEWYRTEKVKLKVEPVVLATQFHYRFIVIHPFDDGNGRTARLLMNFILMSFGYPPVVVRTDGKPDYLAVLRQADAGNLEPFIAFIAENLIRSLELMIRAAKGEAIEEPDDLDKEISLLEHQLKQFDVEQRVLKSAEAVRHVFRHSILEHVRKLADRTAFFDKYYLNKEFRISVIMPLGVIKDINQINKIESMITDEVEEISFSIKYSDEKIPVLENINAFFQVDYRFMLNKFVVKNWMSTSITKHYGSILETSEINELVKRAVREKIVELNQQLKKASEKK